MLDVAQGYQRERTKQTSGRGSASQQGCHGSRLLLCFSHPDEAVRVAEQDRHADRGGLVRFRREEETCITEDRARNGVQ